MRIVGGKGLVGSLCDRSSAKECLMTLEAYLQQTAATRAERMAWWHAARFGMFIHWGLYSQLGRHEWVRNREGIPIPEYEKLAPTWRPGPTPAREWARLAKQAGMKYMVLTTKHHEGFCLWATQQTDYNAARLGPHRDLVAEYVAACREYGLKVGFYYSLMDWHHPDGALCATDEAARRRFRRRRQLITQHWPGPRWLCAAGGRGAPQRRGQLARRQPRGRLWPGGPHCRAAGIDAHRPMEPEGQHGLFLGHALARQRAGHWRAARA